MPTRLKSVRHAEDLLARLESDEVIPATELRHIFQAVDVMIARTLTTKNEVLRSVSKRTSPARVALNFGAWIIGVGGYLTGIGDYLFYELSPLGFGGLICGIIGLAIGAGLWQLDSWDEQEDLDREADTIGWIAVLKPIAEELKRRASEMDTPLLAPPAMLPFVLDIPAAIKPPLGGSRRL